MNKTLSVAAIQNGTVIDHIAFGQALRIIQWLRLLPNKHQVTVGLNLPSKRMQVKDIIKIENHTLTPKQANEIMIFAPDATINIIQQFEVVEKIITTLPQTIRHIFRCPNLQCITQHEPIATFFTITDHAKQVTLTCHFCEKTFPRNQMQVSV